MTTKRPAAPGSPVPAPARLGPPHWLSLALLAAATFAAFAGVLRNGWILFDDPHYVYENPHVDQGWRTADALWFLAHSHGANWHPLTSWAHMLDVQLFGLDPGAHHAVSLLLHVLNAVLLVLALHRLSGAWWRSLLVGALFALHPLRVESVAWAAELKDVLSGLFFALTLGAYALWAERPGRARWAVVVALLALGLMSKPMLVTLPFVLVLLDLWPLGRRTGTTRRAGVRAASRPLGGLLAEKWSLFALAAASAVVTFLVQRQEGAVASALVVAPARRVANALIAYWQYVAKSLWPSGLTVFYPLDRGAAAGGVALAAAAAALGIAAVTWLALRQLRRRPWLAVGWLWYLGTLVPVIGLIQVGRQAYADRYTYLPVIGLTLAVVWGLGEWVAPRRAARAVAVAAALAVLAALSVATARQVALWRDTRTLFTAALAVVPDNPLAHQCLGDDLLKQGKAAEAIPHYQAAIRAMPDFHDAHNKLGSALGAVHRYDEAIAQFKQALALSEQPETRHNLGRVYEQQGRIDEAIVEYETALREEPDHYLSLVHLAGTAGQRGRVQESEACLRHALRLKPEDANVRRLLAVLLLNQERTDEALAQYGEILRRDPDDLDALNNVAWVRATHAEARYRDGAEAVRLAERARDRSREPVAVLYSTLAAAYAEAGRFPDAVRAGERAVALARAQGDAAQATGFAGQLARYRAGRPFHFGE